MRLRHWLLIGSSVSLMTIAPAGITVAQDAGLTDACVAAGITTPDDCAAFEKKGGAAPEEQAPAEQAAPPAEAPAPAEEAAPPPAEEQAAPPAEEPAPAKEAAPPAEEKAAPPAEEPAPAQEEAAPPAEQQAPAEEATPPAEEPAPAKEAAPPAEEAAPPAEQAPAEQAAPPAEEQPAPAKEAAPAEEQQAPAEKAPAPAEQPPAEQAPAPAEQPPAEQQAPAPQEQPAPEEPAPAVPEQQPSPQEPAPAGQGADIGTDLQAAVANYQSAVAGLIEAQTGGGDVAAAQADIADAKGQVDSLCSQGGFASTDECLAQYGLTLPNVPGGAAAPAEQPATPAEGQQPAQPGAEQPGEAATPPSPEQVQEELKNDPALQDQPKEDVTNLPAGVDPNAVAPLLDSAKDEVTAIESGAAPAEEQQAPAAEGQQPQEQQQPAEEAGPPPDSDAAAQAAVQVQPQEIDPLSAEEGQRLEAPPPVEVPQNVTIVNNNTTVVNNNTSVTNNVTNNNVTNNVNTEVNNTQIVMQVGDRLVISNPQQERARFVQQDDEVYYEQLSGGRVRETVQRPDGSKVVTIRNRYGEVLQRSRVTPDGREYILAYYSPQADQEDQDVFYTDPGASLPPLRLNIPVDQYVLDASSADEQQLQSFLLQPPVEPVRRLYTISEVKNSARIRDSVRRLEIGGLTFDTGKATISRDQVGNLSQVAAAMQAVLKENPAETFLIEGHTDAVGSDLANLRLSDLRANTVAQVLTDFYDIPPENLATQGYGERYLKIRTEAAERENRRVTIRRITPLITPVANR